MFRTGRESTQDEPCSSEDINISSVSEWDVASVGKILVEEEVRYTREVVQYIWFKFHCILFFSTKGKAEAEEKLYQ